MKGIFRIAHLCLSLKKVLRKQRNMALALMCADVLVQDGLLSKMFSALRAFVRLLTRMYPEVLVQDRPLPEGPFAVDARVWFFVGVDAQVLREVRLLPEPLAALRAAVRPAVCVYPFVLEQG